jgi:predicted outer membrane protein
MGCFKEAILVRRTGKIVASFAKKMQRDETKANWTSVKVAGMLKTLRIDFDEVLVRADEKYHNRHRT